MIVHANITSISMNVFAICIWIPMLFIVWASTSAAIVNFTLNEMQLLDWENNGSSIDGIYNLVILSTIDTLYKEDSSINFLSTPLKDVKKEAYIIGHNIIDPTIIGDTSDGTHIKVINNIDIVGIDFKIFIIGLNISSNIGSI